MSAPTPTARGRYARTRSARIAAGTWQPWGDIAAVRDHITELLAARWTVRGISRSSGVSERVIRDIRDGRQAGVYTDTADRILATGSREHAGYLPAEGPRRRLRALAVRGHSLRAVQEETGLDYVGLSDIRRGATRWTHPRVARKIGAAYTRLIGREPVGNAVRVRAQAAAQGWPGADAWTRYTIDDPLAFPLTR